MRVESCCQSLLAEIISEIDPKKTGFCIDVGVGTFAFYCEVFAKLGYPTIAVEPLPVKKLRQLTEIYPIQLIESCLSNIDGKQLLYLGNFAGLFNSNFSSLSPDWFGSSQKTKEVESITLSTLLKRIQPTEITCLKLDIEGWEFNVIEQLPYIDHALLPKVVMFEYGGGVNKNQGKKGWSKEFLEKTWKCLAILKKCGYQSSIMIDFAPDSQERIFDLQTLNLADEQLFNNQSVYGNIISLKDNTISEAKIHGVCQSYYQGSFIDLLVNTLVSR
ncbi:FkbM family methyltransferase [Anabaena sp. UHCC 0451]|uniref:FkbM family methyltransferase n=1 Tax=Anabaena sp. UHCC 0451 TaxID=2055235 RepID=UPI002B2022BD|nr:FkbM family methyltransferase [Anabaena sp. UHCC 0451]MEA5579600.1 FkbM family methyltransferase [Anabaena sp. UHCC 0451]